MIPVSVMATGKGTVSEKIKGRYGPGRPSKFSDLLRPIVFWNLTFQCNLFCDHCYIRAGEGVRKELSTEDAKRVMEEIVELRLPLVVLTGGEPLVRKDFWDIVEPAAGKRFPRLSLSTNGTLINRDVAQRLRDYGFTYVGISIDSPVPEWHDKFRGVRGAFEAALRGIKNLIEVGVPVGIRTTIVKYNVSEIPHIIDWAVENGVERVSLYLLDTVGRGEELRDWLPTHDQLKWLMDVLVEKARQYEGRVEILVVRGNFAGIYLADKLARSREEFFSYLHMLEAQGDCGRKTISIYPDGEVRPCQFIDWISLGNVLEKRLSEILQLDNPALKPFMAIHEMLQGPRCSRCLFRRICGGGSRGRAKTFNGNEWGDDPLCFIDYETIARKWGVKELV